LITRTCYAAVAPSQCRANFSAVTAGTRPAAYILLGNVTGGDGPPGPAPVRCCAECESHLDRMRNERNARGPNKIDGRVRLASRRRSDDRRRRPGRSRLPRTLSPGTRHHHPRLRGAARKRGRRCGVARAYPTDTSTHLASKAGTVYVGATTSDVAGSQPAAGSSDGSSDPTSDVFHLPPSKSLARFRAAKKRWMVTSFKRQMFEEHCKNYF
jgi:hypothetical protein